MTAVFLQVRLNSRRFPEKALAELAGRTVIEHAMAALKEVPSDLHVVLTDEPGAARLADYAEQAGFELYVGDPEDVLGRFAGAAARYGTDTIVRATGDNPLVSPRIARATLSAHHEAECDYTALTDSPLGSGVEVVEADALSHAAEKAQVAYEREHVTPFLYRRPEQFRLCVRSVPDCWKYPYGRVTLDTPYDYRYLEEIFKTLYRGAPIDIDTLVSYLAREDRRSGVSRRHTA